jgi:putative flavoprotein involved in K+ transport
MNVLDVLIIGAGQAGLAAAYYCKQRDLTFLILDGSKRIGDSWRNRYDSLVLFTQRNRDALPGLPFPGDQRGYPSKNEVAAYLKEYASHFSFPLQLETNVLKLEKRGGIFIVTTDRGEFHASAVIVATGAFQKPYIPIVKRARSAVSEIHSSQYKNPSQITPGNVLVVGSGNSAAQIAVELSSTRAVTLSLNKKVRFISNARLENRLTLLQKLGMLHAPRDSWLGKLMQRFSRNLIVGLELKNLIKTDRIVVRPEVKSVDHSKVIFKDHTTIHVACIIWATGFTPNMNWIAIDGATDSHNAPRHTSGISPVSGLYYIGQRWQRSVASELICGVGADADLIVRTLDKQLRRSN